jgi:hypothetical protein
MDNFFSEIGIRAFDFIYISAFFLATMLNFLVLKDKKHRWINYGMLAIFALQCLIYILFHDGGRVKFFAALMLISTLIIQVVVSRRRKPEPMQRSTAR